MKEAPDFTFPAQAPEAVRWAENILRDTPYTDIELTEGYGIRWYPLNPQREPIPGVQSCRVVILAPHEDDAELAAGVTLANHVQQGDDVSELLFTLGSAGRYSRGFDNNTLPNVRLAEALIGGGIMGIQRAGVMKLSDGTLGFKEWFWNGDDPQLRRIAVQLARTLNPHILYSPHPDANVDTHLDHQAVAKVAEMIVNWGIETAFYRNEFPGMVENFQEWRMYSIWPGKQNMDIDLQVEFDPNGPFADLKRRALQAHQTQRGDIYAAGMLGKNRFSGTMAYVDADKDVSIEGFAVKKPRTVIKTQWNG